MHRCCSVFPLLVCAAASAGLHAQTPREVSGSESSAEVSVYTGRQFPVRALRGTLKMQVSPDVLLNDKPERLSPGARIRNLGNMIVPPVTLGDATYVVNYTRNGMGEVQDVWLLTPEEAKAKLPSMTASKPRRGQAVDDGKTPYHELPKFNPTVQR
jgi:hypothetical protein